MVVLHVRPRHDVDIFANWGCVPLLVEYESHFFCVLFVLLLDTHHASLFSTQSASV
jgi:hypothetical protein